LLNVAVELKRYLTVEFYVRSMNLAGGEFQLATLVASFFKLRGYIFRP